MPDHNLADGASPGTFIEQIPIRITINGTEYNRQVASWTSNS